MQSDIKFTLQSQMTMHDNQDLIAVGPASLLATWVTIRTSMTYNRLATIHFEDTHVLQRKKNDRYTQFYHVIIAEVSDQDTMLSLWVAKDHVGFVVAMQYHSELEKEMELSETYQAFTCERKLTEKEIRDVFLQIFADLSKIDPVELATGRSASDNHPNTEQV
jgi:hypothetical protein